MKKTAFTLVELMVAMAIIGVLLGLAVYGVSAAQLAQRNTERKAALQDINLGIQAFVDNYQAYPDDIIYSVDGKTAYIIATGVTAAQCSAANTTAICKAVPLKGAAIRGTASGNGSTKYGFEPECVGGYGLAACLENNTTPFNVGTCTEGFTFSCT